MYNSAVLNTRTCQRRTRVEGIRRTNTRTNMHGIYKLLRYKTRGLWMSSKVDIRSQILKETIFCKNHLTPEIGLHLITPSCKLWNSTLEKSPFQDPYWGFYWPGGQALSRYILDNPDVVQNKNILDFGCGCGATGLVSLMRNANMVLFNDIDNVALDAVKLNGAVNEILPLNFSDKNLIGTECNDIDVVLVGDLLYDDDFGNDLLNWLLKLNERDKKVLIGDPGRFVLKDNPLAKRLECKASYDLLPDTILENRGHSKASVWTFK